MSSKSLDELALDICWRQWSMLGVAGVVRQQSATVIDPEALVLFTGALADRDPRIRDEAIDWCVSYGTSVISTSRMKNLLRPPIARPVARFLATVNERSSARWPAPKGSEAWPGALSKKSLLPRGEKEAALARIQLRALFGVSARAEVLLALLTNRHIENRFVAASELQSTGYSRRNIAFVLDDLERASLLQRRESGNQVRYRLTKRAHLEKLAPCTRGAFLVRWDLVFPALLDAMQFMQNTSSATPNVQSIEARKLVKRLGPTWDALDLAPPDPVRGEEESYGLAIANWLRDFLVPRKWQ